MAGYRSPEQVREQVLHDMGPELGSIYYTLANEVSWLHEKWNQYRQLYAHSAERVTLLNQVAGHFFGIMQIVLFEDILLHLARLTDPPQSAGKDNLSLQRLLKNIPDPAVAADVGALVDAALAACESARVWRNRRIAHRDLGLALATSSDPLPGISRANVESALAAIRAVLNRLEAHFWNSETAYEHVITPGGEADALVHCLCAAVKGKEGAWNR